jgi:single-strand DNA-binding protein
MNSAVLIGRLTKDPETRFTPSGTQVTLFTMAVDRIGKKDETDFINIVAWAKTAELCEKYLSKGKQAAVRGRIQTRNYETGDGKKVYVTEVVADEVKFLTPKSGGGLMEGATTEEIDGPFNY